MLRSISGRRANAENNKKKKRANKYREFIRCRDKYYILCVKRAGTIRNNESASFAAVIFSCGITLSARVVMKQHSLIKNGNESCKGRREGKKEAKVWRGYIYKRAKKKARIIRKRLRPLILLCGEPSLSTCARLIAIHLILIFLAAVFAPQPSAI